MIAFLLKVIVLAAVVVGAYGFVVTRTGGEFTLSSVIQGFKGGLDPAALADLKNMDVQSAKSRLSQSLDDLVTHADSSPVVLGVKITNDSLTTIIDVIQKLPPDQVEQVKSVICAPTPEP